MIKWARPKPRRLWRQPVALAAIAWLTVAVLVALCAPSLITVGPLETRADRSFYPPGAGAPLGADILGRDVLTRVLWGGRWTLGIGVIGLTVSVGLGLPLGLASGILGGPVDVLLMRLVDALLAFPALLMAMAFLALLGRSAVSVALAVGLSAAPAYARIARSAVLEVRVRPYVDAARALGGSEWHILFRHILPNAIAPLIAFAATQMGWVLLNSAALNFLGLGVRPGVPEWGAMLSEGRAYLRNAPWVSAFPGLALTLTVLATNLVGDGLQEALRGR